MKVVKLNFANFPNHCIAYRSLTLHVDVTQDVDAAIIHNCWLSPGDSQMSGADTNINISPLTLDRARKAKEAIEKYYVDMVKIKQERNERYRKIEQLLSQAALSEEEETKVRILYKTSRFSFD